MKGSKRFKDGAWRLTVGLGDGRRLYRTVHAPPNRTGERRADEALAQLVTEARAGRFEATDRMTVAELLDRWIARGDPDWSPKTLATNRQQARDHVTAHIGPMYVDQVREHHIDQLYATLRSDLAPSTVARVFSSVLGPAFNRAVRWRAIAASPVDSFELPDLDDEEVTVPDPDVVTRLIAAADPAFATFLRLAASIGVRRGTLSALRWGTVDLDSQRIRFERANTIGEGGLVEKANKGRRAFTAEIGPKVAAHLVDHRARMRERAFTVGHRLDGRNFVWSRRPDCAGPWRPDSISHLFANTRRAAGVDQAVKLHHLKHFAVSRMLAAGISIDIVAQRAGTAPATLRRVYAHWIPGADAEAAVVMDQLLA